MKKLLAILLSLLLSLSCLTAMAEEAAPETQVYTHPRMGFSVTLPAQWMVVDMDNVQSLIDGYNAGEVTYSGSNALTLTQVAPQLASTDGVMVIDPASNNVMLTGADIGIALTNELFVALMIPMLQSEIETQVPGIEFTSVGEIITYGENQFITLSADYEMMGIPMAIDQLYLLDGSIMYVINITAHSVFGEEIQDAFYTQVLDMLGTFQLPAPVEIF